MNEREVAMRAWLNTDGGRVFVAEHGGPHAALAALYERDADETEAARQLQDETERARGRRPDLADTLAAVRRPVAGQLSGPTADVVQAMNRHDPRWRTTIQDEPRDVRVSDPWGGRES